MFLNHKFGSWLDGTQLLCSSSELQQRAGPTTAVCLNATSNLLCLTYMLNNKLKKYRKGAEREVGQVCLWIQFVGVVLISWAPQKRNIANIWHQWIVQEKWTDEWQKTSTSKQNTILTHVTQLNVSHHKHVNYLNFAWASIISVLRKYWSIIISTSAVQWRL